MSCSKCGTIVPSIASMEGDGFFTITCDSCSGTEIGKHLYLRLSFSWADIAYLSLYHLSSTKTPDHVDDSGRKYYHKKDIADLIQGNWNYLWDRSFTPKWKGTLNGNLHTEKFIQWDDQEKKRSNCWALKEFVLPKIALGLEGRKVIGRMVFNEVMGTFHLEGGEEKSEVDGPMCENTKFVVQEMQILEPKGNLDSVLEDSKSFQKEDLLPLNDQIIREEDSKNGTESDASTSLVEKKRKIEIDDQDFVIFSEKNKVKKETVRRQKRDYIDPKNCINIYPDLDNIKSTVVMCDFPTHSAPQMKITNGGKTVSTDKGYRLSKSSHGVWEGSWYFEVTIEDHPGHVRIGWSQISGDLQAPCGYDGFSYSFRDSPGTLFHQSKAIHDCPPAYFQGYGVGDVLGVLIELPPLTESNRKELQRRLWNPHLDKDYVQIRAKPLQSLKNAQIRYYKNGIDLGQAFSNLYFGKYHAAVSCYMGGKVTFNFGPKFKFPLRKGKGLCHASSLVFSPIDLDTEDQDDIKVEPVSQQD